MIMDNGMLFPENNNMQPSVENTDAISNDFLSILNTDDKLSNEDDFSLWFHDNIAPIENFNDTSRSALDHLSDTALLSPSIDNGVYQLNQNFVGSELFEDVLAPCDVPNDTIFEDYPIDVEGSTQKISFSGYSNNCKDQYRMQEEVAEIQPEGPKQFYIKETHFQDESGNTYIKQEYIPKPEVQANVRYIRKAVMPIAGLKRSRIIKQPPSLDQEDKRYKAQKVIFRPTSKQPMPIQHRTVRQQSPTYNSRIRVSTNSPPMELPQKIFQVRSPPQQLSQGRSPPQQLSQGRSPTQQLFQGRSPPQQLSQVRSPPQQLSQVRSPPQQLSQVRSPPQQLSQVRSPPQQLSQGRSPPQQLSKVRSPPQQLSQGRSPPQQLSQIRSPPQQFVPNRITSPGHHSNRNSVSPGSQIHGYTTPPNPTPALSNTSISPMSGQVINEWEQSIKQNTKPIPAPPTNIMLSSNGRSPPQKCRPKSEELQRACEKNLNHIPNHIAIVGKPGLVVLNSPDKLLSSNTKNLKPKPIHTTRPIIKQTAIPTKVPVTTGIQIKKEMFDRFPVEEAEEKRTNHNAVERKYRYSINDKIQELKNMLVPKDTKIQKSGVLRKAIEHIKDLQNTIAKLKYDNVQLKKKQDILEQNNHVLTLKLAEQGAQVVYLEKTPDLVEPNGSPEENDKNTASAMEQSPGYYGTNSYQQLPDSPESLKNSDGEGGRHVRSNSGSSGGYSSSDESHRAIKKPRYVESHHRDQRTIPMLCMVFMFGIFVPSLLPKHSISPSTFGRTLLAVHYEYDYITPVWVVLMNCLGFLVVTTLSYLFFVIKSKVVIEDQHLLEEQLQEFKTAIRNGENYGVQEDIEQLLCQLGVRTRFSRTSYYLLVLEYLLSILPHNRIVHWLCCNNNTALSQHLLILSCMQYSNKYKKHEKWAGLCYSLQAARYNVTSNNVYLILCMIARNKTLKNHFYRRSKRRDDRWLSNAKEYIIKQQLQSLPIGYNISTYLELCFMRQLICKAAQELVLSRDGLDVRRQRCDDLIKQTTSSLNYLPREYPKTVKELKWMISVLEVYQCKDEEVKTLRYNDATPVTEAISMSYNMFVSNDTVTESDICHVLQLYDSLDDTKYNAVVCVGLDWLFKLQTDIWKRAGGVTVCQKSNFRQTIQLLEMFGEGKAAYKLSLYNAIYRVMIGAGPHCTNEFVTEVLHEQTNIINNEQVLLVKILEQFLPTILHPMKDTLDEHMKIFLRCGE